jgi:hypothetical protein
LQHLISLSVSHQQTLPARLVLSSLGDAELEISDPRLQPTLLIDHCHHSFKMTESSCWALRKIKVVVLGSVSLGVSLPCDTRIMARFGALIEVNVSTSDFQQSCQTEGQQTWEEVP